MPPKKPKLTPEERKELRKQKALQKKLQKVEKKKQIKRDYLEREVKYGEHTIQKYEKNWRDMLIKLTVPRMREELEFAWHNFERAVDCKDFTISLLMDELKDSEEQYMLNFRAHAENLQKLMDFLHDRLDELRSDCESEIQRMQDHYDNDIQDVRSVYNENIDYIKTMLYQIELERRDHNRLKKGEYFSRLDEIEVKNQLQLQKLKATLEKKYQNIFNNMQTFIKDYNQQIKDRKKEHNLLKEQDDNIQILIGSQFKQIKKFYDTIRSYKQKRIDMKQTIGSQLSDLLIERQYFSNSFLTLKNKIEVDKKEDFEKLARLSSSCAQALECLEKLYKKGSMILSLVAVCQKLETKKEKILPFPLNTCGLEEDDVSREDENVDGVKHEMEFFWQRMGQAYGTHYTLQKEKKCLTDEIQVLIDTHNEYCERMLYPPIKTYKFRTTIPNIDANFELSKYSKFYSSDMYIPLQDKDSKN